MAITNVNVVLDGHYYGVGENVPDLGSLIGVKNDDGTRSYSGKNSDYTKLPVYSDLLAGSSAALSDASGLHVYNFDGTTWNAC